MKEAKNYVSRYKNYLLEGVRHLGFVMLRKQNIQYNDLVWVAESVSTCQFQDDTLTSE